MELTTRAGGLRETNFRSCACGKAAARLGYGERTEKSASTRGVIGLKLGWPGVFFDEDKEERAREINLSLDAPPGESLPDQ